MRQHGGNSAIGFHHLRSDITADAVLGEEVKKRGVAQIFFQIRPLGQILRINFRHRQPVPAEVPGKFQESDVLLAHIVQNADGAGSFVG